MTQESNFSHNRLSPRGSASNESGPDNSLLAIEQAQRETPICVVCGSPTIPVARGDEVWLRCSEDQRKSSFFRRLTSFEFVGGHTRRLVIKAERVSAA
jgi:hypothetical protein